ncbi:MAG: PAS domain S-box protein, partial [Nitrospina sp.]|nr:PAS domain S-box protein [Nitrospina sp.]
MAKSDYETELECRILHLETKVKHLTNDLWITGEENDTATANYLEIHSNMEKKIHDRTKDLARTANELRESEERYRFLVEESNDIIWTFDLSSMTYTYFSNSAEKILGYPPEVGRVATLGDVFSPPTKKQVMSAFSKLLSADGDSTRILMEAEHRHKDGGTVWMEINALLHRDSFNKPVCFTGVSREITDRKRAEEALLEREHYLSTIINATRDGFWVLDAKGKVSDVNEAYCHMSGYARNELLQLRIPDLEVDETPDETAARIKRIIKNGSELFETRHRRKDGSVFDVEISVTWLDRDVHQFVCFCRDVTERKKMEQALKESEEKLRVIFDTVYSGVILVDAAGIITFANRRMAEMFGHDMEEFIGTSYPEYMHETQSDAGKHTMLQLIRGDIDHVFVERLYRKKDGTVFWGQISGSRLCHPDGSFSSLVGVIADISERKRLEAQLQQSQKMEAVGTLTGGIAHDYNNLLAVIMGNLSMAREETAPHSVMAGFLHEAEQASSKARALTHELMTLSKGGYPMKKPGSIESLLKEIAGQTQTHDGIDYTFSIQDDLWPVEYDSKQMQYVISNVLINAVEAMPQGGTITIQAENQVIENKGNDSGVPLKDGKYVRISIKDEGRGIPEEDIDKIFDPYFSTKERGVQKGMGLGLTTAYAVVEKHGGNIMVNSTTGVGTTVTIYLPVAEEIEKEKSTRQKGDDITPSISGVQPTIKRILVMDDEEMLRTLAQKMLERLEYKVETVKDGMEAIEKYKKHMDSGEPFDGVILDLTIKGGMGGAQAIKELIKIDPDVKAIVCSGYSNDPVLANYE